MKKHILLAAHLMLSGTYAFATNYPHKDSQDQWYNVKNPKHHQPRSTVENVELGPRPLFLVEDMNASSLKKMLQRCTNKPNKKSDFSIGHRGAPLQFPEHTKESYTAAAQMGAGILECDVTFTKDKELVCRHSQCDLHTTTNILATPLADKCSQNFQPAVYDADGTMLTPAAALCCTSDITLAEFKTLKGKMDAANSFARTVDEYLNATARWRTDLYARKGTLLTHRESIQLFKALKVKMTPELKSPSVAMPFDGFSQTDYAQKMIDEYKAARIPARNVWPQSFNYNDVLYWIEKTPHFGKHAVYLEGRDASPDFDHRDPTTWKPSMEQLIADGANIIAPPIWMLVESQNGKIVPSVYAQHAKAAGLGIITWSFERAGPLANGGGWYYQTLNNDNVIAGEQAVINNDGDMYDVLDVLAQEVGVIGIFSDWPATVTYYANCMNLK